MKLFVATKAFVVCNGKVLLLQESSQYQDGSNAGLWDVVGGRVQPGERWDASLLREIKEETGLSVRIGRPFFVNEWRPVVKGEQRQIVGTFFVCFAASSDVVLSEDHAAYRWIDPKEYQNYKLVDSLMPAFASYLEGEVDLYS